MDYGLKFERLLAKFSRVFKFPQEIFKNSLLAFEVHWRPWPAAPKFKRPQKKSSARKKLKKFLNPLKRTRDYPA
jgi:hypothetical protein